MEPEASETATPTSPAANNASEESQGCQKCIQCCQNQPLWQHCLVIVTIIGSLAGILFGIIDATMDDDRIIVTFPSTPPPRPPPTTLSTPPFPFPSNKPTPSPTPPPFSFPSNQPIPAPTPPPSPFPSNKPTPAPTPPPSPFPSKKPTPAPTPPPTPTPTKSLADICIHVGDHWGLSNVEKTRATIKVGDTTYYPLGSQFQEITENSLKCAPSSFKVPDLTAQTLELRTEIQNHNDDYVWTVTSDEWFEQGTFMTTKQDTNGNEKWLYWKFTVVYL